MSAPETACPWRVGSDACPEGTCGNLDGSGQHFQPNLRFPNPYFGTCLVVSKARRAQHLPWRARRGVRCSALVRSSRISEPCLKPLMVEVSTSVVESSSPQEVTLIKCLKGKTLKKSCGTDRWAPLVLVTKSLDKSAPEMASHLVWELGVFVPKRVSTIKLAALVIFEVAACGNS